MVRHELMLVTGVSVAPTGTAPNAGAARRHATSTRTVDIRIGWSAIGNE